MLTIGDLKVTTNKLESIERLHQNLFLLRRKTNDADYFINNLELFSIIWLT